MGSINDARQQILRALSLTGTGLDINIPYRQWEFRLYISKNEKYLNADDVRSMNGMEVVAETSANLLLTDLKIPALGMSFSSSEETAYFSTPKVVSPTPLTVSTLVKRDRLNNPASLLYNYHLSAYKNGLLKHPRVTYNCVLCLAQRDFLGNINPVPLVVFTGCTFSYPTPSLSVKSNEFMTVTSNITYDDYVIQNPTSTDPTVSA